MTPCGMEFGPSQGLFVPVRTGLIQWLTNGRTFVPYRMWILGFHWLNFTELVNIF